MTLERFVLKTIKFDLQVDHPYKFILKYAKTFIGDKSKIEKIVQMSWTFANDRYVPKHQKALSVMVFYKKKISLEFQIHYFTRDKLLKFKFR